MLIDDYIDYVLNHKDRNEKKGGNKRCFIFDKHVLLYGSFKEKEIKKLIKITNMLKNNGVSIIPTLDYRIRVPENELGYVRGFMLQPRARDEELYLYSMPEDKYKKRLKDIATMSPKKLDKFISDWLAIVDAGLMVDPSKCENFFYSNKGISFIDLNVRQTPTPLKTIFVYVVSVLTGFSRVSTAPNTDCVKIIKKVARSFLTRGLDINDIKEALTSHTSWLGDSKDKKQIDSIVESLMKRQKFERVTSALKNRKAHMLPNKRLVHSI